MSGDSPPPSYYEPPDDLPECPQCGELALREDRTERSVTCEDCGYWDGFDWDAEAERRADPW